MRRPASLLVVAASISAFAADTQVVRGELTLSGDDVRGTITECGTPRAVEVGVMASNQYFEFVSQYKELSGDGQFRVLVEVSGVLRSTSSTGKKPVLDSPRVQAMTRGSCISALPNTSFERTSRRQSAKLKRLRARRPSQPLEGV